MLMSGPGFIRIERGSDGAHVLKLNKVPCYAHFLYNFMIRPTAVMAVFM